MARHKENGVGEPTPINADEKVKVKFLLTVCLEGHPVYLKGMSAELPKKIAEALAKEQAVERVQ